MAFEITNVSEETLFLNYKTRQKKTRVEVANLHKQALKAVTEYEAFNAWVAAVNNPAITAYNDQNAALMGGAEEMLLGLVVALLETIEGMQSAMPDGYDLFPGMPRVVENIEP